MAGVAQHCDPAVAPPVDRRPVEHRPDEGLVHGVDNLLHLRVRDGSGKPPSLLRAIVRVLGTWISIVPFFAGYLPVLFDARRRGLPDLLAGTEVVYSGRSPDG